MQRPFHFDGATTKKLQVENSKISVDGKGLVAVYKAHKAMTKFATNFVYESAEDLGTHVKERMPVEDMITETKNIAN